MRLSDKSFSLMGVGAGTLNVPLLGQAQPVVGAVVYVHLPNFQGLDAGDLFILHPSSTALGRGACFASVK